MKKILLILMCFCLLVVGSGCANDPQEDDGLITLTTITYQTITQTMADGITLESNPWRDLWKEHGIKVEYKSIAADADTVQSKVNMAITSGEIPDFMHVSYATYVELQEAGLLADLTEVFETHASEQLKNMMYADGGTFADFVTEDGRLYAIVQPSDYLDSGGIVAIRSDWMRELGLEEPKNLNDLWAIAKAFKDNKAGGTCTIGIGATKDIANLLPIKYLINAHGGMLTNWVEKDGQLVNGIIQPETKEALRQLREKYAEGLLDQEYGTKTEERLYEDAISGKSGIVIGNYTSPFMLDNGITLGQEWSYYPLYAADGSFAKVEINSSISGCVVVSKDCEHPEAVIQLYNLFVQYANDPERVDLTECSMVSYPALMYETGKNQKNHELYVEYVVNGNAPAEGDKTSDYDRTLQACEKWRVDQDPAGRAMFFIFGPDSTESILKQEIEGGGYYMDAFYGAPGEASTTYSGMLGGLSSQMIANIITGAEDIDYFDEFVSLWKSCGGDEITKEVNEWYQSQKK